MPKVVRRVKRPSAALESNAASADVRRLVAALGGEDSNVRHGAREALVAIGEPAVRPLIQVLGDANEHARWEAAKALSEIRDKNAAAALVAALEDESFGIRWLAAEGLTALGRHALPQLLTALMKRAGSIRLREGALHVLRELAKQGLRDAGRPVVAALEGPGPAVTVPLAAGDAIEKLRREQVGAAARRRRPMSKLLSRKLGRPATEPDERARRSGAP